MTKAELQIQIEELQAALRRAESKVEEAQREAAAANRLRQVGEKARENTIAAIRAYQALYPMRWENGEQVQEGVPQMLVHLERTATV